MNRVSSAANAGLQYFRKMSGDAHVLRLPERFPMEQVDQMIERLMKLPEVEYVGADTIMTHTLAPNDPQYTDQWHYSEPWGINLPMAWDLTTGSNNIIVAVIDTGITDHTDLSGRAVPGYDFISTEAVGNDGDGRDNNPSDPGDWITPAESSSGTFAGCRVTNSSWHGTHVAGTIGALSNNNLGVTGVNWHSRLLPVRVLGKCGGTLSDVVDAIRWSAGLSVPGAPVNANPAKVLNLSLGGSGACSPIYQNAINDVTAAGATVVVSAGNSNTNVTGAQPANCSGVITVAATDRTGSRSYYSNYGTLVEISAPGGETDVTASNGVLSTLNTGNTTPAADSYAYYQGTSMAAPHISGVISLMLSHNSSLTPNQILQILQNTSKAFPGGSNCTASLCGTGIVDAGAAVYSALQSSAPTQTQTFTPTATNTSTATATQVNACARTLTPTLATPGEAVALSDCVVRVWDATTNGVPPDWEQTGFNDSSWSFAVETSCNAYSTWPPAYRNSHWIWHATCNQTHQYLLFRKHFTLPSGTHIGNIKIRADDGSDVYINGILVGSNNQWQDEHIYDLTPYLVTGDNVIAIRAFNTNEVSGGGGPAGITFSASFVTSSPTSTFTPTATSTLAPISNHLYLSLTANGTVGGVTSADEDILRFDGSSWSLFFDGSDVGVSKPDLFAFSILDADTILMAFHANVTVQGIAATPQDVLRFDATSLGSTTAGTWSMYFDGSDVGFETSAEKIDAVTLLPDGRLLLSTTGNPAVPGLSGLADEDILAFAPSSLGNTTAGSWIWYFDGSDVGLSTTSGEDIDALDVSDGKIYLSTLDAFSVTGVSGTDEDVFVCTPMSLGSNTACTYSPTLYFDGSAFGLSANDVDAIHVFASSPMATITPTMPTITRTPTTTQTDTVGPSPTPTRTPTSTAGPSPTSTGTPTATAVTTFTPTSTADGSDQIFTDGFESGSLSAWTSAATDSGDLVVNPIAALAGVQGLQAVLDDSNTIYVTDDSPTAETRYRVRFHFDPNSIVMASGDVHFIFKGFAGTNTDILQVDFRNFSGAYQIRAKVLNDNSTFVNTNWFAINDGPHSVELDWRAGTGPGANNGGLTLWIDGNQIADLANVDNDTWRVDRVRLGAVGGIDAGTRGTYYFDTFESRRLSYIGP